MYSIGQSPPPLDSIQDYQLVMATEEEGHTFLHFQRAANTGDAKDIQFTVILQCILASVILDPDPGGYSEFQVTGMIEWSQKSRPKKIPRTSSKTPKNP